MTGFRALICGLSGPSLTPDETHFLKQVRPCGVILFARNCVSPEQLRSLTGEIRGYFDSPRYPILIDQEGGRVQRLTAPHWRRYPPASRFQARCSDETQGCNSAYQAARLIARDLTDSGINVNCAPVLDVPAPGSHDIIGDRAYGSTAETVAAFGRAVAQAYLDGGLLPVIKHIPGHGRAGADSHFSLPRISAGLDELTRSDFIPFRALNDMPLAMTAHVLLTALDADRPASSSPGIVRDVIRGLIGFDGFLMCDDISMGALSGTIEERARSVLAAGCDGVLHCNGRLAEMELVAANTPVLAGDALRRYEAALDRLSEPKPFDLAAAEAVLTETLAVSA